MTTLTREQIKEIEYRLGDDDPHIRTLCRLALNGLSAEEHLVPALQQIHAFFASPLPTVAFAFSCMSKSTEALAAYAKDSEAV